MFSVILKTNSKQHATPWCIIQKKVATLVRLAQYVSWQFYLRIKDLTRWQLEVPFIVVRLIKARRCLPDTEWVSIARGEMRPCAAYACEYRVDILEKALFWEYLRCLMWGKTLIIIAKLKHIFHPKISGIYYILVAKKSG